jgi:hypothetical protein
MTTDAIYPFGNPDDDTPRGDDRFLGDAWFEIGLYQGWLRKLTPDEAARTPREDRIYDGRSQCHYTERIHAYVISLQEGCRRVVRGALKRTAGRLVDQLPLPPPLKRYIRFDDIL